MVGSLWSESDERTITQTESASLRLFHRYPEPFSSPYAFHSLVVHLPPEFFEQRSDPPIPVSPEPGREVDDVGPQSFLIVPDSWSMSLSGSRLSESTPGPSFRDFRMNSLNALYALAATRRAQKFPSAASLRISLSRVRSETARRRRRFSFSSSFRRLACSTVRPPYSLRQR